MNRESKNAPTSLAEFSKNINSFTLRFKSSVMEQLYRKKRVDPLNINIPFKIILIVLLLLVGVRRLALVIFTFYSVNSTMIHSISGYINFGVLLLSCLIELVIYCVKALRPAKGFVAMVYIYFLVTYASYENEGPLLRTVPLYFFNPYSSDINKS